MEIIKTVFNEEAYLTSVDMSYLGH